MLRNLRPQYAKAFRCIGPDCEDTCCQGWEVLIDRESSERLRGIPGLRETVNQHLVVISRSKTEHARIELTSSHTCPFLSPERLCRIQLEHGEHNLPEICAVYPRSTQHIDGLKETSLMLACPEAARLVLLNPDLVQPENGDAPRYHRFAQMGPVKATGAPYQFLWEIRAFCLLLIRDREYSLWQRLFLLGMFCRRLQEVTRARELGLVPLLLREHSAIIAEGRLRESMEAIPLRTGMQLATVLEILNRHLGTPAGKHPRFRECIKDFLAGIQCAEDAPIANCAPQFEQNNLRFCTPLLAAHPHLLENYLVNHVFRTRFPYGLPSQAPDADPVAEFLMMCILYALIKTLMVGISGLAQGDFSPAHVVKIVQSVAKSVEQYPKFPLADYASLATSDGFTLLLRSNG